MSNLNSNANEIIDILIGQVCAVSKPRKNCYGQSVKGILVKARDTNEQGWVNVSANAEVKYADYVQLNYRKVGNPQVHVIDRDGFDF